MNAVRYHVRHDTTYHYTLPVRQSYHLLRMTPRSFGHQRCIEHRYTIDPAPSRHQYFHDSFGNRIEVLFLDVPHETLSVRSESWVEVQPPAPIDLADSPNVGAVREALAYRAGKLLDPDALSATAFLFESTHVRLKRDFAHWAREVFDDTTPLLAATDALMRRVHTEFHFDPEATETSTDVTEVFANRRGVCQDFAHFMISCLRACGLSARYMSGYILTQPPPGQPRLIGADATHAWVSVFCPGRGWVDFDPTNAVIPATEHITIGWGRDFSDISPMRGVITGGGGHDLEIAVTMIPEDEFAELFTDAGMPSLNLRRDGS